MMNENVANLFLVVEHFGKGSDKVLNVGSEENVVFL